MNTFDLDLINNIRDLLLEKGQTVAVAESVTSGHLQLALSLADQASSYFQGGITAYNIGQKSRHLHIDPIHGEQVNCVSRQIAQQMADHVCYIFTAYWGLGITGYATKVPEQGINELFAYYAISKNGRTLAHGKITAGEDAAPMEVRYYFTNQLLSHFVNVIVSP
ncbi:CinA family protein [Chitinophaga sp.]|uniref:CinA family protein n=1 Tax=Chitinophaga sp. TaxID=1869181 RepID=UPI0031D9135B